MIALQSPESVKDGVVQLAGLLQVNPHWGGFLSGLLDAAIGDALAGALAIRGHRME